MKGIRNRMPSRVYMFSWIAAIISAPAVCFASVNPSPANSTSCRSILARGASAFIHAPVRVIKWPFKTKTRTTVTVLGATLFIAPIYPSSEGVVSPAMNTYFYVRDWLDSSSNNLEQMKIIESALTHERGEP